MSVKSALLYIGLLFCWNCVRSLSVELGSEYRGPQWWHWGSDLGFNCNRLLEMHWHFKIYGWINFLTVTCECLPCFVNSKQLTIKQPFWRTHYLLYKAFATSFSHVFRPVKIKSNIDGRYGFASCHFSQEWKFPVLDVTMLIL